MKVAQTYGLRDRTVPQSYTVRESVGAKPRHPAIQSHVEKMRRGSGVRHNIGRENMNLAREVPRACCGTLLKLPFERLKWTQIKIFILKDPPKCGHFREGLLSKLF